MSVFLPLDGLSLRARLLILLLAREAELTVDQVDSPHARALARRGLADGEDTGAGSGNTADSEEQDGGGENASAGDNSSNDNSSNDSTSEADTP